MIALCFDSDILIDHLNDKTGKSVATSLVKSVEENLILGYVSTITVAELYVGAYITGTEADVKRLLRLFHKVLLDATLGEKAGSIRGWSLKTGLEMTLSDAIIAASALKAKTKHLVTKNRDDYLGRVKGLSIKTPKEVYRELFRRT